MALNNIFLQELETYYHYHLEQSRGLSGSLSLPDLSIQYKDFALKGLGMLSVKYSASPIILCGGLQLIKKQILSTNNFIK